ncbi:PREDICTED: uncharacterized protein LOC108966545 [Bactrocera latifrons]|uniref:uncharacterized protein LOC108966545 n=1 Tax=Bactrocera latifrons TaxID=174628 RepID=UPI0008DE851C|nr:PREDICTED: uncharacterized protein LOC108966545 [Bactrocera latifrons]
MGCGLTPNTPFPERESVKEVVPLQAGDCKDDFSKSTPAGEEGIIMLLKWGHKAFTMQVFDRRHQEASYRYPEYSIQTGPNLPRPHFTASRRPYWTGRPIAL